MPISKAIVTVSTVSHLAAALVTLRTAQKHGQFDYYCVFLVDAYNETRARVSEHLAATFPSITFFGPDDLGQRRAAYVRAGKYYRAFEMSCMAKYFAVAHLLDEMSVDYCVYADGDLLVLGDLTESFDELSNKIILLTPHVLGPVGDAREQGFLVHGWANAGFFCVRREAGQTRLVLDWLVQRVSERGFLAPHLGLSCDQTWLSSLPYLFHDQTVVSQNPALNVAYWNLEERQLSSRDGRILVSGRPLLFFHFSGFDSADSRLLSKHADVRVSEGTTLSLLWHLYASELASVVPLTTALNELDVLSFSTSPLSERLLAGSVENGINIDGPFVRPGLFSRIGHRFDLLLARKGWKNGTA